MSDIDALEERITAALDRIQQGVGKIGESAGSDATDTLQAALDEELAAKAALEQRMQSLSGDHNKQIAALDARIGESDAEIAELKLELEKARKSTEDLQKVNLQLRTEMASSQPADDNLADELTALKTKQAEDAAEVDAILAELKPLLEETRDAAG